MKLILRDRNQGMVDAWNSQFRGVPEMSKSGAGIFLTLKPMPLCLRPIRSGS
jgi:hypothetical protein